MSVASGLSAEDSSMRARAARSDALLNAPVLPTLLRLSAPNAVAMLAAALVAIAETAYVGVLGTVPLAGLALVFPMVMLQQMLSAGAMGGGISSAVSRALGSGDNERAANIALHAVLIGVVAGVVFTALFLLLGPAIYTLLGGHDAIHAAALAYSNVLFAGAAGIWLMNTFASIIRGTGNMRVPSATLFLVAAGQIAIGGGLGLGLAGLPRLGMAGIALGQVVAFGAAAAFLLWYLRSGRAGIRLSFSGGLQRELFWDILKVGALACLSPLQSVLTILVLTRLIASFGPGALAGYGIGARLEFLLIPIIFAVGVASVPLVGMAIGAGDVQRAKRITWTSGVVSATFAGAVGLLVAVFPGLWSGLFTNDPAVLEPAASYLAWAGPCFAFLGLGTSLYFASQGAGRVIGPVLAQGLRLMIVIVGGGWLAYVHAPQWTMFALVGAAMAAYGIATAISVYLLPWGQSQLPEGRAIGASTKIS